MKLHWRMPQGLKNYFKNELKIYRAEFDNGHLLSAWRHLERAHIIGQPWPKEHTYVHWLMLKFGFKVKSIREVIGQIPRLLVGGIKSFVGEIPVGNTGGASVPPLRPMEIPHDIEELMKPYVNTKN